MNEEELKANIADDTTIDLAANINLTSSVKIVNTVGLLIEGNGFKVDGQHNGSCFAIHSGSKNIIFRNLTIMNGNTVKNIIRKNDSKDCDHHSPFYFCFCFLCLLFR